MLGKILQRFKKQPIGAEHINDAVAHYKKGCKWTEKERYSEALEEFKYSSTIIQTEALIYFRLGFTYFKLNCFSEAKKAYQKFIELHANLDMNSGLDIDDDLDIGVIKAEAYNHLGLIYDSEGKFVKAIGSFLNSIRIIRSNADALNNLGETYFKMGIYHDAIKAHEQVLAFDSDNARAHYRLGLVYLDLRERQQVMKESEILEDLDKGLADDLMNRLQYTSSYSVRS